MFTLEAHDTLEAQGIDIYGAEWVNKVGCSAAVCLTLYCARERQGIMLVVFHACRVSNSLGSDSALPMGSWHNAQKTPLQAWKHGNWQSLLQFLLFS